jgi:hypothetical protein
MLALDAEHEPTHTRHARRFLIACRRPASSIRYLFHAILLVPTTSPGAAMGGLCLTPPLHGHGRAHDLLPDLESLTHLLAVLGGGEPVAFRSEVLADGIRRGEKTLRVLWGFTPLYPPLSPAGRLMRVFRTIVEVAVLAMFHAREILPLRSPRALHRSCPVTTAKSCYRRAVSLHAGDVAQCRTRGCRLRFSVSPCRTRRASRSTSCTTPLLSGLVSMPKMRCEPSCFTKRR